MASILDSARALGIRDAQVFMQQRNGQTRADAGHRRYPWQLAVAFRGGMAGAAEAAGSRAVGRWRAWRLAERAPGN